MTKEFLKITIISDLHCCLKSEDNSTNGSTYLYSDSPRIPTNQHPVSSVLNFIKEKELYSDILLCPGDLANKASKMGLQSGWGYILEIQEALKCNHVAATLGNHDVNSRHTNGELPFANVRSLGREYPIIGRSLDDFWANNFCIVQEQEFDLLVFNSSYSHDSPENAKYCTIDAITLERMEDKLKSLNQDKSYRIALCHHHPLKHSNLIYQDWDSIDKGDDFIKLLDKYNFQIIIHGHKHEPRLTYGINCFPVFASGSFSSLMNLNETGSRNIFHELTLFPKKRKGLIKSYEFNLKYGWSLKTIFPHKTGFGYKDDLDDLAEACNIWLGTKEIARLEHLFNDIPNIQFLIPDHDEKFKVILRKKYGIVLEEHTIVKLIQ